MAQIHSLITPKTARIFTHGNLSESTKIIWIVTHGYGYLAEFFIKKFEVLDPDEHFVIVPEALSRFYLKDVSGRVGASWMTTEDREHEIQDYIQYLDNVYETFILHSKAKVVALGFSQGAATICRWAINTHKLLNNIVLWGGTVPSDCLHDIPKLNSFSPYLLVGDEDQFIDKEKSKEIITGFNNLGLTFSHIFYKGGHSILTEPLMQLTDALTQA